MKVRRGVDAYGFPTEHTNDKCGLCREEMFAWFPSPRVVVVRRRRRNRPPILSEEEVIAFTNAEFQEACRTRTRYFRRWASRLRLDGGAFHREERARAEVDFQVAVAELEAEGFAVMVRVPTRRVCHCGICGEAGHNRRTCPQA